MTFHVERWRCFIWLTPWRSSSARFGRCPLTLGARLIDFGRRFILHRGTSVVRQIHMFHWRHTRGPAVVGLFQAGFALLLFHRGGGFAGRRIRRFRGGLLNRCRLLGGRTDFVTRLRVTGGRITGARAVASARGTAGGGVAAVVAADVAEQPELLVTITV